MPAQAQVSSLSGNAGVERQERGTGRNRVTRVRNTAGFTLIELLVVISIIMLLASILLPSLSKAKALARIVVCEAKLHALTRAWAMYSHDNDGWLCGAYQYNNSSPWVKQGNDEEDVMEGVLWPYTGLIEMYHCPSDQSEFHSSAKHRVSYAMSDYTGGNSGSDPGGGYKPEKHWGHIPCPADTFVFIEEEDPRAWNKGSFMCHAVWEMFDDVPADWHLDGVVLSFGDGHVEYWKWQDRRTVEITSVNTPSPGNPDLKRLVRAWYPHWYGFGVTH